MIKNIGDRVVSTRHTLNGSFQVMQGLLGEVTDIVENGIVVKWNQLDKKVFYETERIPNFMQEVKLSPVQKLKEKLIQLKKQSILDKENIKIDEEDIHFIDGRIENLDYCIKSLEKIIEEEQ